MPVPRERAGKEPIFGVTKSTEKKQAERPAALLSVGSDRVLRDRMLRCRGVPFAAAPVYLENRKKAVRRAQPVHLRLCHGVPAHADFQYALPAHSAADDQTLSARNAHRQGHMQRSDAAHRRRGRDRSVVDGAAAARCQHLLARRVGGLLYERGVPVGERPSEG